MKSAILFWHCRTSHKRSPDERLPLFWKNIYFKLFPLYFHVNKPITKGHPSFDHFCSIFGGSPKRVLELHGAIHTFFWHWNNILLAVRSVWFLCLHTAPTLPVHRWLVWKSHPSMWTSLVPSTWATWLRWWVTLLPVYLHGWTSVPSYVSVPQLESSSPSVGLEGSMSNHFSHTCTYHYWGARIACW